MNLDNLTHTSGEWLRGSGPESNIVISSRIRLARNLAAFPFTNRASSYQKAEIEALLRDRIAKVELDPKLGYLPVPSLSTLDRQFLVERSSSAASWPPPTARAGVALLPAETVSLMVNEEDHLRLQVMRSGFTLDEAWQEIDRVDDMLEQRVGYAFSEEFGYLTACPTNVGTGMRASVMLHLPALEYTKQIEKVFRALQKINLAVRGLYGEGSRASGHFYQISNQVTLGKSETGILGEIHGVIPQIINYERQARAAWLRDNRGGLQDKVSRAYGTLCSATMMTSEETMELLSYVRLGVNLGLIGDITIPTVNELFIHTQPAHLQKLMGAALDGEAQRRPRPLPPHPTPGGGGASELRQNAERRRLRRAKRRRRFVGFWARFSLTGEKRRVALYGWVLENKKFGDRRDCAMLAPISRDAVVVSDASFGSDEPSDIVESNVFFLNALLEPAPHGTRGLVRRTPKLLCRLLPRRSEQRWVFAVRVQLSLEFKVHRLCARRDGRDACTTASGFVRGRDTAGRTVRAREAQVVLRQRVFRRERRP